MTKPLGLTMGDGAGLGPELLLRSYRALSEAGPIVVFGSVMALQAALASLRSRGIPDLVDGVVAVATPDEAVSVPSSVMAVIDCLPLPASLFDVDYPWGRAVPAFGTLQHAALKRATESALRGEIAAVVTLPWHKALLGLCGLPVTGHTECLEAWAASGPVMMLLAGPSLRVGLVTAHMPLREVANAVTQERVVAAGSSLHDGLVRDFGIASPRIAVCGLNPHAGESGELGDEEERVIAPALGQLRAQGIDVTGPFAADTLFPRIVSGRQPADAVLAMYHDQGLAPLKAVSFGAAANITLGLHIVRTSVDHGTAYDIAGRGEGSAASLMVAAEVARAMASRRAP
jgi:4-hydroxythreonine-4-phosphate dehydrogenase